MEIIGECHHRGLRTGKDLPRILPLLRLPPEIGHRAPVTGGQPPIELRGVRSAVETCDASEGESQRGRAPLDLDAALDGVHSPIVSRRQRAKFTISSTGGTACGSPYAVTIRHCMYARGGTGRNGGCRHHVRERKLHVSRNKSTASRGRSNARSAKRTYNPDQLAIGCIPSVYSRPMTLASSVQPRALGLVRYRGEFPIFRDSVYLNTCSLGALGERSRRKVAEFLDIWQRRGASAWYDVWWDALSDLRARYGKIVNAAPAEIALAPSISVALSAVAEAIDYRQRPKVVITSLDFPTVAYQWLAKARAGVELVVVESPDRISVPVEAIAGAIDDRTALVVTSHVYFTSGAIQDIKRIAAAAHARGALCLIDAYQSVGQIPVDVQDAGVDALVAGGLKWLLGGPGIVFLYMRQELARRFEPAIAGWFGQREQFAFDPRALTFHDDTRRFELGTPALAAAYAQLGGLEYIEEIGIPAILATTAELTEH